MELKTVKIREQKQVVISKDELLKILGFDPEEWNLYSAYVSNSEGKIMFGISEKNEKSPFELVYE